MPSIPAQFHTDNAILAELGRRLAEHRLAANLTQAQLAQQAGVSKRTLERAEAGESIQLLTLVRLLRVLDLLPALEHWLAPPRPRPLEQLAEQKADYQSGRQRRRARGGKSTAEHPWEWGEGE